MSVSKNRLKDDGEKGMSTRRTAKSTERESLSHYEDSDKKSLPLLYQCSKCHFILSNSNCLFRTIQLDEPILLFPPQTENFVIDTEQVYFSPEATYDQFCAFYVVVCSKCSHHIGKFYLSTTEKVGEAKNALAIPESNFLIYDINTAKIATPSGKKGKQSENTNTGKKKVVSSTTKEDKENKENRERSSRKQNISPAQPDKFTSGPRYQSPLPKGPEERKYDEESRNTLLESDEKDLNQIKQVDNSFNEMKSILTNFAQLLEQFDIRLSGSEKTIALIHDTLNEIYKKLDVREMIDLSDS